jgi:hypothetical protein
MTAVEKRLREELAALQVEVSCSAVKHLPKSVVREIRTLRSVGAGGGSWLEQPTLSRKGEGRIPGCVSGEHSGMLPGFVTGAPVNEGRLCSTQ